MLPKCLELKNFLCRYPLALGGNVFAITMICVKIVCIIAIAAIMIGFSRCEACTQPVLKCAYGFGGTAIIYCIIMIIVHLWFLWAIKNRNRSVVLIWVVVTTMWLAQTFCVFLVFLCMYIAEASFVSWILCAVFGLIAFCIAVYGIAVGYGLWVEMKPPA